MPKGRKGCMSNALWWFPGSMDEGVSEGLPSMQGSSNTGGHAEDDERYPNLSQHVLPVNNIDKPHKQGV